MAHEKSMVSVVVPVYNASGYIRKCVDTLQAQTYPNVEIILVDDGSSDNSLAILKEIVGNVTNVRVISQKNSGPSAARNNGIRNAKGKYIMFCDSDDTVEKAWVDRYVIALEQYPDSLIIGNVNVISESGESQKLASIRKENYTKDEYCELFLYGLSGSVYNKIYRTDVINECNIQFDESKRRGEDVLFNLQYIQYVDGYHLLKDALYNYYRYDSMETLTNCYHPDDFDLQRMLYINRLPHISKMDLQRFQRHYWIVFNKELDRTMNLADSFNIFQKLKANNEAVKADEYQDLLLQFGKNSMHILQYLVLRCGRYDLYYMIQCLAQKKRIR